MGVHVVIFSHTHMLLVRKNGEVVYYNIGCACAGGASNTMLTIDDYGNVAVHEFSDDGKHLGILDFDLVA